MKKLYVFFTLLCILLAAQVCLAEELVLNNTDFEEAISGWTLNNGAACDVKLEKLKEDFGYSYSISAPYANAPFLQFSDAAGAFVSGDITVEADFMTDSEKGRYDLCVVYQSNRKTNNDCYIQNGVLSQTAKIKPGQWYHLKYVFNLSDKKSSIYLGDTLIKENTEFSTDGTFGGISFMIRNIASFSGNTAGMKLSLDNIKITANAHPTQSVAASYIAPDGTRLTGLIPTDAMYAEVEFNRGLVAQNSVSVTAMNGENKDCYVWCNKSNPKLLRIYFKEPLEANTKYNIDLSGLTDEWSCKVMHNDIISFETDGGSYSDIEWSLWTKSEKIEDISQLQKTSGIRLQASFKNVYEDEWKPCILVLAAYEDNKLIGAEIEQVTVPPYVPDSYVTTPYMLIDNGDISGRDITFKGFLWEKDTILPEVEKFLLEKAAQDIKKPMTTSFAALTEYAEDEIVNPSSYLHGYDAAKEYFAGTVCFAADSDYIFGIDRKYKISEKPIYTDGGIWVEQGVLESIFGREAWDKTTVVESKTYVNLKAAAKLLGLCESESYKGLAVVSDKAYDISGNSAIEYVKQQLRYIIFERPSRETLRAAAESAGYPSVILSSAREQQMLDSQDYTMQQMSKQIVADAQALLDGEVVTAVGGSGVYDGADYSTIQKLYWAYKVTGDISYADKAIAHAVAMAQWEHWKAEENFFLQTSYSMLTCGYVYDLFYDEMSDEQRKIVAEGIIEKGLKPARDHLYGRGMSNWPLRTTNWNVVCNSGAIVAALAVAKDYETELCFDIVEKALASLEYAVIEYGPDGGWYEGVGYSGYTAVYHTLAIHSLMSVFGDDYGIANTPGFLKNGYFPFYMTSADGKFNLHDDQLGINHSLVSAQSMWAAQYTNDRTLRDMRIEQIRYLNNNKPTFLDMLWYQSDSEAANTSPAPLDVTYEYAGIATSRSGWDYGASWLGVHAGDNSVSHGQMDIGQFEFESNGVKFAIDLGRDRYSLPNYFNFGSTRENYYACRAEGHNLYVINPSTLPGQYYYAASDIKTVEAKPDGVIYTIDMTPAYVGQVKDAKRGFMLVDNRRVMVLQDEIVPAASGDKYFWFWHVDKGTSITINSRTHVTLEKNGEILDLYFASDSWFDTPKVEAVAPLATSPQDSAQLQDHQGFEKLLVRFNSANDKIRFRVTAVPRGRAYEYDAPIVDIDDWRIEDKASSSCYDISGTTISGVRYGTDISEFLSNINSIGAKRIMHDGEEVTDGGLKEGMQLVSGGITYDISYKTVDTTAVNRKIYNLPWQTPTGLVLYLTNATPYDTSAQIPEFIPETGFNLKLPGSSRITTAQLRQKYLDADFDSYTGRITAETTAAQTIPGFSSVDFTAEAGSGLALCGEGGRLHITGEPESDCVIQMFKDTVADVGQRIQAEFDFTADNLNTDFALELRLGENAISAVRFGTDGVMYAFGAPVMRYDAECDYHIELITEPGVSRLYTLKVNGSEAACYTAAQLAGAALTQVKVRAVTNAGQTSSVWLDNISVKEIY